VACAAAAPVQAKAMLYGAAWLDMGSIVKSSNTGDDASLPKEYEKNWLNTAGIFLGGEAPLWANFKGEFGLGAMFLYPIALDPNDAEYKSKLNVGFVGRADLLATFGSHRYPYLQLKLGYFPYKYSPHAHNLGEYLIRSIAYPTTVLSGFDRQFVGGGAYTNILGLQVHSTLGPEVARVKQDLIVRAESEVPPYFDMSVAYLASLSIRKVFEVGVGVDLYHLVPVNDKITTPYENIKDDSNEVAMSEYLTWVYDEDSNVVALTSRAVKAMVRMSLDLKRLFPNEYRVFGAEDLVLYSELALLGLRDYPYYYEDLTQRMPIMVGLNLPGFKVVDKISVEIQHLKCPHENDYYRLLYEGYPIPLVYDTSNLALGQQQDSTFDAEADNWKWSVKILKKFKNKVGITAQAASDNLMPLHIWLRPQAENPLVRPGDWYWMLQVSYYF
jgi:hypothetical protein